MISGSIQGCDEKIYKTHLLLGHQTYFQFHIFSVISGAEKYLKIGGN